MSRFVAEQCRDDRDSEEELSEGESENGEDLEGFVVPDADLGPEAPDESSHHELWMSHEREEDERLRLRVEKRLRDLQAEEQPVNCALASADVPCASQAAAAKLAKHRRKEAETLAREEFASAQAAARMAEARAEKVLQAKIALGLCDDTTPAPAPVPQQAKSPAPVKYRIPKKRAQ
eukprot:3348170-Prymnesium_polylepis.2